jgi:hypothetical protein
VRSTRKGFATRGASMEVAAAFDAEDVTGMRRGCRIRATSMPERAETTVTSGVKSIAQRSEFGMAKRGPGREGTRPWEK